MYSLKGKIKKFLEMTFIGEERIAKEIILELLIANDESLEGINFSYRNHSYVVEGQGFEDDIVYTFFRDGDKVFRFKVLEDEVIVNVGVSKLHQDRLYKAWKELV